MTEEGGRRRDSPCLPSSFILDSRSLAMTRPPTRRVLVLTAAAFAGARAAFLDVYKVLMHPRCLNCHPPGDVPLQGDDSHLHIQNVKRGEDGKGKYALKC